MAIKNKLFSVVVEYSILFKLAPNFVLESIDEINVTKHYLLHLLLLDCKHEVDLTSETVVENFVIFEIKYIEHNTFLILALALLFR